MPFAGICALVVGPDLLIHVVAAWLCRTDRVPWLFRYDVSLGIFVAMLIPAIVLASRAPRPQRFRRVLGICVVLLVTHIVAWFGGTMVLTMRWLVPITP